MPRINQVQLLGYVSDMPSVVYSGEGKALRAAVPVSCMQRNTDRQRHPETLNSAPYHLVWVMTENADLIEIIRECRPYDIVQVEGVFRVSAFRKKAFCDRCGEPHVYLSKRMTVCPLFFDIRRHTGKEYGVDTSRPVSAAQEARLLADICGYINARSELSNSIELVGVVAREPVLYETVCEDNGNGQPRTRSLCPILLCVKRKLFIDGEEDIKVDWITVLCRGRDASEYSKILHKGNLVLVDGYIRTRDYFCRVPCDNCMPEIPPDRVAEGSDADFRHRFRDTNRMTEIHPYSIEILKEDVSLSVTRSDGGTEMKPQIIGTEADAYLAERTVEKIAECAEQNKDLPGDIRDIAEKTDNVCFGVLRHIEKQGSGAS